LTLAISSFIERIPRSGETQTMMLISATLVMGVKSRWDPTRGSCKATIDRVREVAGEQDGVAVGCGARDVLRGDVGAGAGLVVNHHRLADFPGQLVGDDAREKITAAPGRKSDHEPQRPVRVALSPRRHRSDHQQNHGQGVTREEVHGSLLQLDLTACGHTVSWHGIFRMRSTGPRPTWIRMC